LIKFERSLSAEDMKLLPNSQGGIGILS